MTGYPFQGRIFIAGYSATVVTAWKIRTWDTDASGLLPGQTSAAWRVRSWDTDADDAEPNVSGFKWQTELLT